jgi:VWFA-related protein
MSNRCRAFLRLFILAIPLTGWTQDPQAPAFKARTDVVLVPVVVRSKQGPVEGLKPEQFSVLDDGKPQKIVTVELIKTGAKVQRRVAPGEFSNELDASGPARLTIIGIDTINTPFLDQTFARRQLLKYVANSLDIGNQVAIFSMYRDGSVRMLHDITSDPALLAAAIKGTTGALPNSAADSKAAPPVSRAETEQSIYSRNKNALGGDPEVVRAADEAQALQAFQDTTAGAGAYELRRNMEATLESMRQIAEAFSGAPGRKSFIWITGSFPFDITGTADLVSPRASFYGFSQDPGRYYSQNSGALPPLPETASVVSDDVLNPLRQEFRILLQQFATGNFVLYPVDARGLMTLNAEAADEHANKLLQQLDRERAQVSQSSMATIAKMTGGKSCYNNNDIANCVRDAADDAEQYYLLSYNRDKKNNKQGWRTVSVKVDQPDAEVRARTGYFYGGDAGDKNARTREISAAARSSVPFSSVQFSARFTGSSVEGAKKAVKYEIYLPPETISAVDQGDNKVELELIAIASNPKEPKVDTVSETVGKNLPPDAVAAIHKQGLAYSNVLKLSPGEYNVHFIVRNVATNVVGSVIAPLRVE